ncbi:MAG: hypothetical protein J6I73_08405 [Treponema sp.]|nr:hypothetical protein [Treponema sp.]MBQ9239280.1 hypothetical protein [Treponema sp.]
MNEKEITKHVHAFYDFIKKDSQHRYKSWEHCYAFFYEHHNRLCKADILDKAALHLGMYLASWGMFRGSGGLLWKDYTIYKDLLVRVQPLLFKDEPKELSDVIGNFFNSVKVEKADKIHNPPENIEDIDIEKTEGKNIKPTITLVSKIMLGLDASCTALDEYVCSGIEKSCKCKNFYQNPYTEIPNALAEVKKFYDEHKQEFDELQNDIQLELDCGAQIPYPPIKLLDMYFFQIGERK